MHKVTFYSLLFGAESWSSRLHAPVYIDVVHRSCTYRLQAQWRQKHWLETQANIQALLLLRRDPPLRRDCLLLFLFWLQLRRVGAAVRNIMPQRGSQLLAVVGEDLRSYALRETAT